MVYMADRPDGECYRCENERETTTHMIHFFDDRDSQTVDLCPSCVRVVQNSDNPVRSIT